jgi:outer membrane protein OmpA-like peptidoglycan-associated protein
LTPLDAANPTRGSFRINLSLTDIKTGFIVAQSVARVRGDGVDTTPTPFYRDSPSFTKDRVVDGQIRTAQAPTGSSADEVYLSRMPINALVGEASKLYEAGNYAEALRYYDAAAARPEGAQLRVFNGLYLANTQLGRTDDAEKAFAKIVALGLATNSLSVKFLYRPGSLEFLADPKISGPYTMWLRLIAREVAASKVCLTLAGHTSRTGTEQFNDRLSLQRAVAMQRRIEGTGPETAGVRSRPEWGSGKYRRVRERTIWATRSTVASNSRCGLLDQAATQFQAAARNDDGVTMMPCRAAPRSPRRGAGRSGNPGPGGRPASAGTPPAPRFPRPRR